jgi:hypothetical protein
VIGLEARGLGAGPRTSYRRVELRPVDRIVALAGLAAGIAGTAAALAAGPGNGASNAIDVPAPVAVALVALALVIFGAVVWRAVLALRGR